MISSYLGITPTFKGNGSELNVLSGILGDLFAIPVADGYTDEELISALHDYLEGGVKNPYTDRPIIMEASPGNFTVQRENGKIIGFSLYHRSGAERAFPF